MYIHNLPSGIPLFGGFEIAFYSLAYVAGFLAFYFGLKKIGGLSSSKADSLVTWAILGCVLFARIFFFLFYRPDLFSVIEFFKVYNGGLSFHGGFVGLVVSVYFWCKKYNHSFWKIADIASLIGPWFLSLGRFMNFVNGELFGPPFDGSWCVVFPKIDDICRHPTQLYSVAKNAVIGLIMLGFYKSKKQFSDGFLFWIFVFLYGGFRFTVQFWRLDGFMIYGLWTGQWLSLVMLTFAGVVLWRKYSSDLVNLFKRA